MTAYLRPATLPDAVAALDRDGSAHLLAGGTDLINEIRLGIVRPDVVVDTAELAELRQFTIGDDEIVIGAGRTMSDVLQAPLGGRLAALCDAADLLGGRQMQAVASLGGNICHASPAAETATPLLVHDAVLGVAGPDGRRSVPIAEFWAGPRRTTLGRGELLVDLRIPGAAARRASAYRRIELRKSVDIALVSAAAALEIVDGVVRTARLAVGAAGPVPFRAEQAEERLLGVRVTLDPLSGAPSGDFAEAISAAERAASAQATPIDDVRASAEYRRAMVGVVAGFNVRRVCAADCRWPAPLLFREPMP